MSLFENDAYTWRETYFILFQEGNRPQLAQMKKLFTTLGAQYEITETRADDQGRFESVTILSPDDYAAMDITYVTGEEVAEQRKELLEELSTATLNAGELKKMDQLPKCDARFDVYHFEQNVYDEDAEFMDPGALLVVLEKIADMCSGVCIDPQSGTIV